MSPSEMSELLTILQGAGGGILAGGIAWLLFWKANQRNEKLVDDRMTALEKSDQECQRHRRELQNQIYVFQNDMITKQSEVMREIVSVLKTFK